MRNKQYTYDYVISGLINWKQKWETSNIYILFRCANLKLVGYVPIGFSDLSLVEQYGSDEESNGRLLAVADTS